MSEIDNEPSEEEEQPDEQEEVQEPEPEDEPEEAKPATARATVTVHPVTARPQSKVVKPKGKGGRPKKAAPVARPVSATPRSSTGTLNEAQYDEEAEALQGVMNSILASKRAAATEEEAKGAMDNLRTAMGKLTPETARHLAASEEFQEAMLRIASAAKARPGDPIYDDKGREISRVPMTFQDMCEIYPMYEWVPRRNDIIEVNGVSVQVWEGVRAKGPKIFYDVQEESINKEREADRSHLAVLTGSIAAYGDGFTADAIGWHKMTDDELLAQPGNVDR
jgi:hypothetical protein